MSGPRTWAELDFPEDPWDTALDAIIASAEGLDEDALLQELGLAEMDPSEQAKSLQASDVQVLPAVLEALHTTKKTTLHEDPIQDCMDLGLSLAREQLNLPNTYAARLSAFFFGDQPKLHASKEVIGKLISISSDQVEPTLSLLSDLLVHLERQCHASLMNSLVNSDCKLILFCEITRFDETPMLVSYRQAAHQVVGHAAAARSSRRNLPHGKATTPCKMLCTSYKGGGVPEMGPQPLRAPMFFLEFLGVP